jgi:hypothetical protein
MRFLLPVLAATLMVGGFAHAGELDNEAQVTNETKALSKDLPQTLVVRTNAATGEVQVMHSSDRLAANASSTALVAKGVFVKSTLGQTQGGELDRDSSQSSWYFCWNQGYSYPYYGYGGYNFSYNYYYGYNWGGWNYSYYRWNWGWY